MSKKERIIWKLDMLGTLYVAATPIGNLEDITLRALRIMREASYVLCEDTRNTKHLLMKHGIKTPTLSYHQHSGAGKTSQIIRYLSEGKDLVLVSDAGTPGISDPGSALVASVREAYGEKAQISPLPGASAVISALSVSGWPVDRFSFFGFLPHKKGRQTMIKEMLASQYPVVFYESKHRLLKCLQEISSASDLVEIMVARELTKIFESFYFGSPSKLLQELSSNIELQKGEFVVLMRKKKSGKN